MGNAVIGTLTTVHLKELEAALVRKDWPEAAYIVLNKMSWALTPSIKVRGVFWSWRFVYEKIMRERLRDVR